MTVHQAPEPPRSPRPTSRPALLATPLGRYRLLAWVVGVGLLVLVGVGVPLKYLAHTPAVVMVVGPLHGFLFMVYLVCALQLAVLRRWSVVRTLLVMAAGTVPVLSFVAERSVAREVVRVRSS